MTNKENECLERILTNPPLLMMLSIALSHMQCLDEY